jgi:hypothetical protein
VDRGFSPTMDFVSIQMLCIPNLYSAFLIQKKAKRVNFFQSRKNLGLKESKNSL